MDELAMRVQHVEDQCNDHNKRIDKLEESNKALTELALSVESLATNQSNMKEDVKEIKKDIKCLTSVPGKRWNTLVDKAITLLAGGFIAWLLSGVNL